MSIAAQTSRCHRHLTRTIAGGRTSFQHAWTCMPASIMPPWSFATSMALTPRETAVSLGRVRPVSGAGWSTFVRSAPFIRTGKLALRPSIRDQITDEPGGSASLTRSASQLARVLGMPSPMGASRSKGRGLARMGSHSKAAACAAAGRGLGVRKCWAATSASRAPPLPPRSGLAPRDTSSTPASLQSSRNARYKGDQATPLRSGAVSPVAASGRRKAAIKDGQLAQAEGCAARSQGSTETAALGVRGGGGLPCHTT